MRALLHPRSVAIVGASDDGSKTTGRPLRFLRKAGYRGSVYPVNPRRASVLGERAWPSIDALPEVPDHAYIVTSTELALEAVEQCGRFGVPFATILASGFGEAGEEGRRREDRLRGIVASTGIRVVGPSSLGVVNLHERLLLTANAAFAEPEWVPGSIFVASHSGSMIGAILTRGKARGIGFAGLVSAGNEVDLCIGEICESTLADANVGGYLLFLETLRRADALGRFALAAARAGKPIIAYKLGRSRAAADLAVTHTGALAGEDDVADAFFREFGIARVQTLEGLIEGLPLLARIAPRGPAPPSRPPRVGIVTTTGGGAAMVVEELGVRGVSLAPLTDLTLAGTSYPVMKAALDQALASPALDLVVAVPGSSARFEPELTVRAVIDSAGSDKPLAAFIVPDAPEALARLAQAGVPAFRTPEACADAIAAAFARRDVLRRGVMPRTKDELAPDPQGMLLDEMAAYKLLDGLGIRHAPAEVLDARAHKTWVEYPVAVKILSTEVPHKTEAGGVVLGVRDWQQLREAIAAIRGRVEARCPGVKAERFLVQAMVHGVGEALVGYRVHPQVGPIVVVAAGGVLTEIYRDRSIRLAPVDMDTAREMVSEVSVFKALAGYRGRTAGDTEALAAAIVALSRVALEADSPVLEAEVNPLLVLESGRGVLAVDALVRVAAAAVIRTDAAALGGS